jgi:hypothetical protein
MRSIGHKSQYDLGIKDGGGPQTIQHFDFNEDDPAAVTNVANPCPNHIYKEILFLVKTVKKGVCEICVEDHIRQHHEIVSIDDAVAEC